MQCNQIKMCHVHARNSFPKMSVLCPDHIWTGSGYKTTQNQVLVTYLSLVEASAIRSKLNQAIKVLLGGRSRDQVDLRTNKINGSRTQGCNLTFDSWSQAIKNFRRHQAHFLLIKKLDHGHKRFNWRHISDYIPLEMSKTSNIKQQKWK